MVPVHLFGARPQNMTSSPAEYDISGEMPGGIWYNLVKNKAELLPNGFRLFIMEIENDPAAGPGKKERL